MQTSDNIADLAAALAKAQGAIDTAKKDATNPHFKSKYADLASVWDACRKALSDNGLSVVQTPGECGGNQVEMTTMLLHASGQWISDRLTIPLAKVDAQGYGSAITYARRYALSAMVGVAPDDDDGNAATKPGPNAVPNDAPRQRVTLRGPIKSQTELSKEAKAFMLEVYNAADPDALDAWMVEKKALIDQIKDEFPGWWDGTETKEAGMDEQIGAAYLRLQSNPEDADGEI
jgi:hypothetical protein